MNADRAVTADQLPSGHLDSRNYSDLVLATSNYCLVPAKSGVVIGDCKGRDTCFSRILDKFGWAI